MSNGTTPSPPEPESFPHAEEIKQRWEHARHSDRAAVDTGLTALNAAILVNAGSLVALLALSGQLWKDDRATATKILANSYSFVWGLALAVVASAVAYFYQSLVTRRELRTLGQMMGRNSAPSRALRICIGVLALIMVGLVGVSYVMFVIGATSIASALQSLSVK